MFVYLDSPVNLEVVFVYSPQLEADLEDIDVAGDDDQLISRHRKRDV